MISLMRVIVFRAALSTALVSCNEKRTTYYENGNEKSVEELKDGILNGRYMFFYDDGQLAAEGTNLNGVHHGEEIMYFENGTVQERKTWKNGLLNGPKKVFDQDGRVTAIFNYKDDVQVGNETFFYPNGRVSHLQTYDSVGNLVYKMKWDSANHKVYSREVPIVKVSRDTVRVYEECLVSVSFGYPLTGAINIEFEAIKSKNQPSIRFNKDSLHNTFLFALNFKQPEVQEFIISARHRPYPGDTISADGSGQMVKIVVVGGKEI